MTAVSGRVGFVIIARDEDPEVVSRTVAELAATTTGHDRSILVVDDGSRSPIDYLPSEVSVVRNQQPLGVSRARRLGSALSDGDVLVNLDAHRRFTPGWLEAMLDHVDTGAVLCPAAVNYDRTSRMIFGADFRWRRDGRERGATPGFDIAYRYDAGGRKVCDVPSVAGACIVMGRHTYDRLGGFSPLFRGWGYEDQDISLRAHQAGIPVRCVTGAVVAHLFRSRFPYSGVSRDVVEYNQLLMIRSIFAPRTASRLERAFRPCRPAVDRWLADTDISRWREVVRRDIAHGDRALLTHVGLRPPW